MKPKEEVALWEKIKTELDKLPTTYRSQNYTMFIREVINNINELNEKIQNQ